MFTKIRLTTDSRVMALPLYILVDGTKVGDTRPGTTTDFLVPSGKCTITVQKRGGLTSNSLNLDVWGDGPVDISCFMDTESGTKATLVLIDERDEARAQQLKKQIRLRNKVAVAGATLYIIGSLTVILGLASWFFVDFFGSGFNSPVLITLGIFLIFLGYFVQKGSMLALVIAIAVYVWDLLSGVGLLLQGNLAAITSIVIHLVFLSSMLKGIGAIRALNKAKKD